MIVMVISSNLVRSADFDFYSPDKVNVNEEFQVQIISELRGDYDVKIYLSEENSSAILSEIFDDTWRDPFKYILSTYPKKESFSIRALNPTKSGNLCVQIRLSGETKYEKICKRIEVMDNLSSNPNKQEDNVIVLNYPSEKESVQLTKDYKIDKIILYSFIIFLIVIILFLLLKLL